MFDVWSVFHASQRLYMLFLIRLITPYYIIAYLLIYYTTGCDRSVCYLSFGILQCVSSCSVVAGFNRVASYFHLLVGMDHWYSLYGFQLAVSKLVITVEWFSAYRNRMAVHHPMHIVYKPTSLTAQCKEPLTVWALKTIQCLGWAFWLNRDNQQI